MALGFRGVFASSGWEESGVRCLMQHRAAAAERSQSTAQRGDAVPRHDVVLPPGLAALDGFRVLACLAIILFHCMMYWAMLLPSRHVEQVGGGREDEVEGMAGAVVARASDRARGERRRERLCEERDRAPHD